MYVWTGEPILFLFCIVPFWYDIYKSQLKAGFVKWTKFIWTKSNRDYTIIGSINICSTLPCIPNLKLFYVVNVVQLTFVNP